MIAIEILGYTGMVILLISLAMKNIWILRILNAIGSVICAVYGFLSWTLPTALLNIGMLAINIIHIIIMEINRRKAK